MLWFLLACFLPAFVVSTALTVVIRRYAANWGLVDQPGTRKVHLKATPLGGGLAIFLGFLLPIVAAQCVVMLVQWEALPSSWIPDALIPHLAGVSYRAVQLWWLIGAASVLVLVGVLDDRFGLSWKLRLCVQFGVAITLVFSGVSASLFVSQPWVGQVASVLWIVALINSLNFLDNMDGLSAGIGLIATTMFASIMLSAVGEPRWLVGGCLVVLAGSLSGFLIHNWPPATIFMGDAGSTFIGLMLSSLTILGTFYDESMSQRHVMLAPLCILAIPLYDLGSVIFIRLQEGRSPFQPDKKHFSHRLAAMGFSKKYAVLIVHFATITTGLGGMLLYSVSDWRGAALVVSLVMCTLVVISILETAPRLAPDDLESEKRSDAEALDESGSAAQAS